jgi:hypothetical protein
VDAPTARSRGLRFLSCCASNLYRVITYLEMTEKLEITDEEAALYDRQIRVWGVQAQNMYAFSCFFLP